MDMTVRGPVYGGTGSTSPFTSGLTGAQRVQDAHARYMEMVRSGNLYALNVGAGAATAYTGGAAGTPLLAVHNPLNSGKQFNLVAAFLASRVAASAAGTATFGLWGGPSVIPTGTRTIPTNLLSLAPSGSAAAAFVNAALTGSSALSLLFPLATYYWATAASGIIAPGWIDLAGLVMLTPGNQVALGATAALTSATYDATLIWEELPYIP